ncbi:MAG: hypothetical protein V3S01_05570 [Dehalococcoidia bacterium]
MTFEILLAAIGLLEEVVALIGEGAEILTRQVTPEQMAELKAKMNAAEDRWEES